MVLSPKFQENYVCPSWAKMHLLQESCKSRPKTHFLQESWKIMHTLQDSCKSMHFLQDFFREYFSWKMLTKILQDSYYFQESCKKSIVCEIISRNVFFLNHDKTKKLQKRLWRMMKSNLTRNVRSEFPFWKFGSSKFFNGSNLLVSFKVDIFCHYYSLPSLWKLDFVEMFVSLQVSVKMVTVIVLLGPKSIFRHMLVILIWRNNSKI